MIIDKKGVNPVRVAFNNYAQRIKPGSAYNRIGINNEIEILSGTPAFASLPEVSAQVDVFYSYTLQAVSPNNSDILTITTELTLPSWLSITDNEDGTAVLSGTPSFTDIEDILISIRVTDQLGAFSAQRFTLSITSGVLSTTASLTRASESFTLDYALVPDDTAVVERVRYSDISFVPKINTTSPFTDAFVAWDYATALSNAKALATTYPNDIIYEDLLANDPLVSARELPALRIFDREDRPIIIIQTGVHGDEIDGIAGIHHMIGQLMTSNDPLYVWARENICLYWIVGANPDGMALQTRKNVSDVNLNRQFPYFWKDTPDTDKGSAALSEKETLATANWLREQNRLSRGLLIVDMHGWTSQTVYGFLTDQMNPGGVQAMSTMRSAYHNLNNLMQSRDYSGRTIVNGLSNMRAQERRSKRKPYIIYWAQLFMRPDSYGYLFEYPETENAGLNTTVAMDVFDSLLLTARDTLSGDKAATLVAPSVLPADVINNNSHIEDWNSSENRPNWFTANRLVLNNNTEDPNKENTSAEEFRPDSSALSFGVSKPATVLIDTGVQDTSFWLMVGGLRTPSEDSSSTVTIEYLAPPPPPEIGLDPNTYFPEVNQISIDSLPTPISDMGIAYDGTQWVYVTCGFNSNDSSYRQEIYRIDVTDIENNLWELWHTITGNGRQRHTSHIWNNKLLLIGGRDPTVYLNEILQVDLTTKVESVLINFTVARGWHGSEILNNELFVVGGWTGGGTLSDSFKVDLTIPAILPMANINFARRGCDLILTDPTGDAELWWVGGRGSTTHSETIYRYDISADSWTGFLSGSGYTRLDTGTTEEDVTSAEPFFRSLAGQVLNPYTDDILIIGGEDDIGALRSSIYLFNWVDRTMSNREVSDDTWGYIRASSVFTVSPGDDVCLHVAYKNTSRVPVVTQSDTVAPYLRPSVYVGPSLTNSYRKRTPYTVPGYGETFTYPVFFQVHSDSYTVNQQLRVYNRHYTGGTSGEVKAMQIINKPFCGVTVDDVSGRSEDQYSCTLNDGSLTAENTGEIRAAFNARWGSQMNVTVPVLSFICDLGFDLQNLELEYVGSHTIDLAGSFRPLYDTTGIFNLKYTINGSPFTVAVATGLEFNHDRFIPNYKQDTLHFRLLSNGQDQLIFELNFYNTTYSVIVPTNSFSVNGFTSNGSGISIWTFNNDTLYENDQLVKGPVAYWPLNNASLPISSKTSNGWNMEGYNTINLLGDSVHPDNDASIEVQFSTDGLRLANGTIGEIFGRARDRTVEFWYKPALVGQNSNRTLFHYKDPSNNQEMELFVTSANKVTLKFVEANLTEHLYEFDTTIRPNIPYHFVLYNTVRTVPFLSNVRITFNLFINGAFQPRYLSSANTYASTSGDPDMIFGNNIDRNRAAFGNLSDLAIGTKSLTKHPADMYYKSISRYFNPTLSGYPSVGNLLDISADGKIVENTGVSGAGSEISVANYRRAAFRGNAGEGLSSDPIMGYYLEFHIESAGGNNLALGLVQDDFDNLNRYFGNEQVKDSFLIRQFTGAPPGSVTAEFFTYATGSEQYLIQPFVDRNNFVDGDVLQLCIFYGSSTSSILNVGINNTWYMSEGPLALDTMIQTVGGEFTGVGVTDLQLGQRIRAPVTLDPTHPGIRPAVQLGSVGQKVKLALRSGEFKYSLPLNTIGWGDSNAEELL